MMTFFSPASSNGRKRRSISAGSSLPQSRQNRNRCRRRLGVMTATPSASLRERPGPVREGRGALPSSVYPNRLAAAITSPVTKAAPHEVQASFRPCRPPNERSLVCFRLGLNWGTTPLIGSKGRAVLCWCNRPSGSGARFAGPPPAL
jgi:hypothetical protein